MDRRRGILIGCPQYRVLVRGTYACDQNGRYLLGGDGKFLLGHARCEQHGGRCMQTLCVLHRYNRGGPASWYPEKILADSHGKRRPRPPKTPSAAPANASDLDVLR